MSPTDRAHLVSDTLTNGSSSQVAHGDMNSCGVVRGNSGGAVVHGNSCVTHGAEVLGRTKPMSMSTGCTAWHPAVESLLLDSRRQEVCMMRRGQIASGASA